MSQVCISFIQLSMSKLIWLVLIFMIYTTPTSGCKAIERRAMYMLKMGTPEQVQVFNKITEGDELTEVEVALFHSAQEDAFQEMLTELKTAVKSSPLQERQEYGFSGTCLDSTMALSDMSEYDIHAIAALEHTKNTYPYRLRGVSSAPRGNFHPLITWLCEDSGYNPTFEYRVTGKKIPDYVRIKVKTKGGLDWLKTIEKNNMLEELHSFLSEETVSSLRYKTQEPISVLREMKAYEEGNLSFYGKIITKRPHEGGEILRTSVKKVAHSTFIYKISEDKAIIIDHLYNEIITIDFRLDDVALKSKLTRYINKYRKESINDLILKYQNSKSAAERAFYNVFIMKYLGYVPEPGERFKEVTDIYWKMVTRNKAK